MVRFVVKLVSLLGTIFIALTLLIWLVELKGRDMSFIDAFWYSAVTVTTVGYGDIFPETTAGRIAGLLLFAFSITVFTFLVSTIQREVAARQRQKELGMDGTKFSNHVAICGWSRIAGVALRELLAADRKVAIITRNPEDVPLIRQLGTEKSIFVTVGDSTAEEALERANVLLANTVVAAADDDTENLIVALHIRRLNPGARIVVATKRPELRSTLTATGVTYVASPFELSGRLIASAAFEPEVAQFVEDVTSGADDDDDEGYDLQQFTIPATSSLANLTAGQVMGALRQIQGPLLVGVAKAVGNGHYKVFPHPDEQMPVSPSDSLIVLGNPSQNGRVAQMLGVVQGR